MHPVNYSVKYCTVCHIHYCIILLPGKRKGAQGTKIECRARERATRNRQKLTDNCLTKPPVSNRTRPAAFAHQMNRIGCLCIANCDGPFDDALCCLKVRHSFCGYALVLHMHVFRAGILSRSASRFVSLILFGVTRPLHSPQDGLRHCPL
jgi:hypothetical protein